MKYGQLIDDLFASIDAKNVPTFLTFVSDDCLFRFGNIPPVSGKQAIGSFVSAFFDSVSALEHEIADTWEVSRGVLCHGIVAYTRHDLSVLSVPFSNVLKFNDGRINEYLIFSDTSDL